MTISFSRVCDNHHGIIRKYGLNMCRRCFRDYSDKIGFKKVRVAHLYDFVANNVNFQSSVLSLAVTFVCVKFVDH